MKHNRFFVYLISCTLLLTACSKNITVSNTPLSSEVETSNENSNSLNENTQSSKTLYISNKENAQIQIESSNIEKETSFVEKTLAIDEDIQSYLDSNNYTWDNPMVITNPYQNSPLTALILFKTEEKTGVKVTVKGKDELYDISNEINEHTTAHRVPVIGLYGNYKNTVLLELTDENNNTIASKEIKIRTDSLPESLNNMVKVEKHTVKSAYDLTLITGQSCTNPFAYDEAGDIRWVITETGGSNGVFPLSNGRFIYQTGDYLVPSHEKPHPSNLYEMDYLGRAYRQYFVEQGVHHDVSEKTPNGNLLIITNSNQNYVEDVVMELDRETGEVVKKLDLKDVLGNYFRNKVDWAHTNTISYDEESDTVLLSPRNTHSAIKVNWSTDELVWILGNPEVWEGSGLEDKVLKPSGNIIWNYQQHAVYEINPTDGKDNLDYYIMFDNHWDKARKVDCFDNREDSYTLIYSVDEENFTVSQEKIYTGLKSKITSNSTYDAENNRVFAMSGNLKNSQDGYWGMNYEYDYETGEILNQYSIKERFYRGYHMIYDYEDMAQPFELYNNYIGGNLTAPENMTEQLSEYSIPDTQINNNIDFKIQDTILYMFANDHAVKQVIFVGQENCYVYDKSHITLYDESYLSYSYYTPIPLSGMNSDTYAITLIYNDDIYYDTGKTFTINKDL